MDPTLVTEVTEATTPENLEMIVESVQRLDVMAQLICGFLLFFVVVTLCHFCYRFFKIFF